MPGGRAEQAQQSGHATQHRAVLRHCRVRLSCNPTDCSPSGSSVHEIFPGKSPGVGWDFPLSDPGMEPAPGFPEEVSFASLVGWLGLLQREGTGKEPRCWRLGAEWRPSCGSAGVRLGGEPFNQLSHAGGAAPPRSDRHRAGAQRGVVTVTQLRCRQHGRDPSVSLTTMETVREHIFDY